MSVETRQTARGVSYVARYTLTTGKRPSVPAQRTWQLAFAEACAAQEKVDRARYRDPSAGQMTFAELVTEHYLPLQAELSPVTCRSLASHLGDATGRPRGKGAKVERAARLSLLAVFGGRALRDLAPQDIRLWQAELLREHYAHSTILAKRSLLRGILELAAVNGWMDLNPVDAVPKPRARQRSDDDRVLTPEEWQLLRAGIHGDAAGLLVDLALDTGLRIGEVTALRPSDLIDATADEPEHVWVRQAVAWPGARFSDNGGTWQLKEPKGRRWRKVAVSPSVFRRALDYIDACQLTPDALLFDQVRMRAEQDRTQPLTSRQQQPVAGRYVSPTTRRSGAHGKSATYDLGCRCDPCRTASSNARFWWARQRGRESARPWLEPGFLASRADAVDPVVPSWLARAVWRPAVAAAGIDWRPTFHDLRHAMVTWSLEAGASVLSVQRDAGHASLQTTEIYVHRLSRRVDGSRLAAPSRYQLGLGTLRIAGDGSGGLT